MSVVVDTNVAVVAEGLANHADDECVNSCMVRLLAIVESGGLLLDDDDAIIEEYTITLGHSGRPGIGRAFVKWAFNYRFDTARCRRIPIKETRTGGWRRYNEFPDVSALSKFDQSDQKFVAVAIASLVKPPIVNAVDSDWWDNRTALLAAGLNLEFLCPHLHRDKGNRDKDIHHFPRPHPSSQSSLVITKQKNRRNLDGSMRDGVPNPPQP